MLAPVHRSNVDFALTAIVTRRPMRYMGKDSIWKSKPLGRFVSMLGAFPVHRGSADRDALKACTDIVNGGSPLVMFPEGTRQTGPVVEEMFDGTAYVAAKADVPIIPMGIGGTEAMMPKGAKLHPPGQARAHRRRSDPAAGARPRPAARPAARSPRSPSSLHEEIQDALRRGPGRAPVTPTRLGDGSGPARRQRSRRHPARPRRRRVAADEGGRASGRRGRDPRGGRHGSEPVDGRAAGRAGRRPRPRGVLQRRVAVPPAGAPLPRQLPDRRCRDRRDPATGSTSTCPAACTAGRPTTTSTTRTGSSPTAPTWTARRARTWRSAPVRLRSGSSWSGTRSVQHYALLDRVVPAGPWGSFATTSGAPFVEITGDGVDKAFGIRQVCDSLGIAPDEVVAFGDNHNDLAMVKCGGPRHRHGQRPPRPARRGRRADRRNVEDGVAAVLETLVWTRSCRVRAHAARKRRRTVRRAWRWRRPRAPGSKCSSGRVS